MQGDTLSFTASNSGYSTVARDLSTLFLSYESHAWWTACRIFDESESYTGGRGTS